MSALPQTYTISNINKEENLNYFQKLWNFRYYLTVEPFYFFFLLATVFNRIAIQYFPIAKACHVNLGYNNIVCNAIFTKSQYQIDCRNFIFENITEFKASLSDSLFFNITSKDFEYSVCKAEVGAQKLTANIFGKRMPIGK